MSQILQKAESFVTDLLTNELDPNFLYHNLRHTQRVVESLQELLDHYQPKGKTKEALLLAAWFHDTGYTKAIQEHEKNSCILAREFLEKEGVDFAQIEQICAYIMATQKGYEPKNLEEQLIRDADASHLGQKSYPDTTELLRMELSQLGIADYTPSEWREENIKMFRAEHYYYTDYAKENWQARKDKNIKKLVKRKKDEKDIAKKEMLKAKFKSESPERGIQTMFRVTMRNHLKLSDIADTKANILLSVNAIIISLVLANLIPKLDNPYNEYLIIPTSIFLLFSIISMIFAILATRPNVTSGEFSKEDVEQKKVNLLFFGNFHKMALPDYEWAIQELIKDKAFVYSNLTKDLYYLGVVLQKKYKLLRLTYTIFAIGMVLSVVAFIIALKFYGPERVLDQLTTP